MTFLLSEDAAIRKQLQGINVTDQKATGEDTLREVNVWFGMPDQEIRAQTYPYITIDMIDVNKDSSREMRGKVDDSRYPYLFANDSTTEGTSRQRDLPIPVNIDYQITTYARHPRHDRQLLAAVMYDRLPLRFGVLEVDDNTIRRLDVLDVAKRDMVEQGKRLFMNAFTIRVSSEVTQGVFKELYEVLSVHIDPPAEERAGGRTSSPNYTSPGTSTITA
jgi:hypothetical protein